MSPTTVRVFVSSTWLDLRPEREAVEAALQRLRETKLVGMEYFGSRDDTTRAVSLAEVDRSQVYVGIFGARYGSGITEAEYRRAREKRLPCFIYFKAEATIAAGQRASDLAGAGELAALKEELRRGHTVPEFMTPDGLATLVATDLHNWLMEQFPTVALRIRNLYQLPAAPAAFTGREEELRDLEAALASAQAGGATICGARAGLQGLGGVGKTALAVVLAHRFQARYPDAQLYLNLRGADPDRRPPVPPADLMASVIHAFHPEARLPESVEDLLPIYRSVLAEAGRVLLLLDNAADAGQVRPLLPPANCLLLVTSRAQFTLPGMATRHLDCLPPAKSRELLLKLAARLDGEAERAAALCGHLPLALEVFAGTVNDKRLYPVADLVGRLRAGQEKLTPVEAAFQLSYDLLAADQRRRWTLLAVFGASFDLRAAAAVWEEAEAGAREGMQGLVNASLVEWNEGNGRFRLHDLVRQFCEGKLEAKAGEAARMRHAQHYRNVGEEADALYKAGGEQVVGGMALFDRERVQLEAAFEWLRERGDKESAAMLLGLVDAVVYVSDLRFHPRQRIRWLEAQRDAARLTGDRKGEGAALGNLGLAYAALGDARKAIEFYEQRLVIAREIGDRRGEGNALGNLGNAYADLGDARKAIDFYEPALAVMREIGDKRAEGSILGDLGNAYADLGDARKAIEYHQQALVIDREIGDRRGEGQDLGNLGNAYAALGDARNAIDFHEQHRAIAREIGDRRGEGAVLGNLGNAYAALGDARKAIDFYEQQLTIVREIGDRRGEGNSLWNSALALEALRQRPEAIARAEAALRIFEQIESPTAATVRAQLAEWRREA